jgi:hypothetical protein
MWFIATLWAGISAASGTLIPAPLERVSTSHDSAPKLLYLNRCADGCTVEPGFEDSRTDHSSIIDSTIELSPFNKSNADWERIVGCVRRLYAPFEIEVTSEDPGDEPHFEAIVAGYPSEAGFPQAGGVSPFTCGVIENAITYTFANIYSGPTEICNVVGQESAHAMGLDHELLACDPLTYLRGCLDKSFQNEDARCGEDDPRPCSCGGTTQNTYQHLLSILGAGQPPAITIQQPADGAFVSSGFEVQGRAIDDHSISEVQLRINGQIVDVDDSGEEVFALRAPGDISPGVHNVEIYAFDDRQVSSHVALEVVQDPCISDESCKEEEICVAGLCVLGPGLPGGLGDRCDVGDNCATSLCAQVDGQGLCTASCELDPLGCPAGFSCQRARSGQEICLPAANTSDSAGGCATGTSGTSLGAALALLLLLGLSSGTRQRRARAVHPTHGARALNNIEAKSGPHRSGRQRRR